MICRTSSFVLVDNVTVMNSKDNNQLALASLLDRYMLLDSQPIIGGKERRLRQTHLKDFVSDQEYLK